MHVSFKFDLRLSIVIAFCAAIAIYSTITAYPELRRYFPQNSSDLAAWFQFVGGVAAVVVAIYFSVHQKNTKLREDEHLAYVAALGLMSVAAINSLQIRRIYTLFLDSKESSDVRSTALSWHSELAKLTAPTDPQMVNIVRSQNSGGIKLAETWGEIEYLKQCVNIWANEDVEILIRYGLFDKMREAHREYVSQFAEICRNIMSSHEEAEAEIKKYCYRHPEGKFAKV